jgi:hypothetical protein
VLARNACATWKEGTLRLRFPNGPSVNPDAPQVWALPSRFLGICIQAQLNSTPLRMYVPRFTRPSRSPSNDQASEPHSLHGQAPIFFRLRPTHRARVESCPCSWPPAFRELGEDPQSRGSSLSEGAGANGPFFDAGVQGTTIRRCRAGEIQVAAKLTADCPFPEYTAFAS